MYRGAVPVEPPVSLEKNVETYRGQAHALDFCLNFFQKVVCHVCLFLGADDFPEYDVFFVRSLCGTVAICWFIDDLQQNLFSISLFFPR